MPLKACEDIMDSKVLETLRVMLSESVSAYFISKQTR
jgi:hypothetical protein